MSQKRSRVPKVSLAMLKGRSAAVSVPSIRFNPGEDDLEVDKESENDGITLPKSSVEFEQQKAATDHRRILTSSSSADGTKELSPTKENPLKFSKRSSSLDSGPYGDGGGKDAWSLFHEIKGKITKTVEETLHIDLRSSDVTPSSQQLDLEDSKSEEKNSPETEMVEEAIKAFGLEANELQCSDTKSSLKNSNPPTPNPVSSPVDKLHALSSDLKHRRTRFLSKTGTPAMSMSSLMATKIDDDDTLEEQLHDEYIKEELQHEEKMERLIKENEENVIRETSLLETSAVDTTEPKQLISTSLEPPVNTVDRKWLLCGGIIVLYCVMPIPSFLVGFILGVLVAGFVVRFYYQLTTPNIRASVPTVFKSSSTFQLPVISNKTATVYKDWMNDLRQPYNPLEYHVSHTHSVFVRLEGSMLRISHTKSKIPKHSSFNEPRHEASFHYQRYYDLTGCQITLLPEGIAKKRLWSRKYPICISLCEGACKTSHVSSINNTLSDGEKGNSNNAEEITVVDSQEKCLYLFTRTCRDKEDWYWRFFKATLTADDKIKETRSAPSSPKHVTNEDEYSIAAVTHVSNEFGSRLQQAAANSISVPDVTQLVSDTESSQNSFEASVLSFFAPEYVLKFENYMKRLMYPMGNVVHEEETVKKTSPVHISSTPRRYSDDGLGIDMKWLNSFLSRSFWDFLEEPYWTMLVKNKIQKKLSKIRLPQFIDELRITDLDFGNQLPVVKNISPPAMDEQGLWIFFDISYDGIFRMTLETKANLLKLKKAESVEMTSPVEQRMSRSAIFNDEEEDSAESSTDDEGVTDVPDTATEEGIVAPTASGTSKKIIRIVDKITQSRYFQHATEFKYVRRAVEEVSNTRLILTVEVHSVAGTVALNIPPPPTDRLWYGFRTDPQVTLLAKPKLGERQLTVFKLTEWIEKKLIQEFQKVFVMPNMDDIPIPFMSSGLSPFPSGNTAQVEQHSSALLMK